jgi:hypothetical protein
MLEWTSVRVYLDLCCLKRPFDDQGMPRVRLEAEAVVSIQKAMEEGAHTFVRAIAQDLENAKNPDPVRRARVDAWLLNQPLPDIEPAAVTARTADLVSAGFGGFDAYHLAWAELLQAEAFVTTDDQLRALAARRPDLRVRVMGPLEFAQEATL